LDIHIFKAIIKGNDEMVDEEIFNLFNFTLRINASNLCNKYMKDYPNYKFVELEQAFYKCYQTMQNNEHVYL